MGGSNKLIPRETGGTSPFTDGVMVAEHTVEIVVLKIGLEPIPRGLAREEKSVAQVIDQAVDRAGLLGCVGGPITIATP